MPTTIRFTSLTRVQEIAEEDNAQRARALERIVEASERPRSGSARDWDPRGAKRCGLAEMRVGNEQRAGSLPEYGALREQNQALPRFVGDRVLCRD